MRSFLPQGFLIFVLRLLTSQNESCWDVVFDIYLFAFDLQSKENILNTAFDVQGKYPTYVTVTDSCFSLQVPRFTVLHILPKIFKWNLHVTFVFVLSEINYNFWLFHRLAKISEWLSLIRLRSLMQNTHKRAKGSQDYKSEKNPILALRKAIIDGKGYKSDTCNIPKMIIVIELEGCVINKSLRRLIGN